MSTKPTGPGRGGDAVEIVFTAISCQSRTASARAICDPPNAVNAKRGRMVKLSSNLFERTRYMGSSLSGRAAMPSLFWGFFGIAQMVALIVAPGQYVRPRMFLHLDCGPRANPSRS